MKDGALPKIIPTRTIRRPERTNHPAVFDFREETVGDVRFRLEAREKTRVIVRYGEYLEELDADMDKELHYYKFPKDVFDLEKGSHDLQSKGRRAFRFIRVEGPDVEVMDISAEHRHYPVEDRGHFCCPDNLLNQIHQVSKNTVKLCMQDFYEDGIKRDGLLWVGDARVEAYCNYYAFGDKELARRSIGMFAATQKEDGSIPACAGSAGGHVHPHMIDYMPNVVQDVQDWILYNYCTDFVSMLWEYLLYTGDVKTARDQYIAADRIMQFLGGKVFRGEINREAIITDEDIHRRDHWWPSEGTFMMQFLAALKDINRLAKILGQDNWDKWIRQTETMIRKKFYCQEKGVYTDISGKCDAVSHHANSFSVLADLPGRKNELNRARNLEEAYYPMAGFMKFWVIKAMMEQGDMEEGLQDTRDYFGLMLRHGATTFWEKLDLKHPDIVLNNPLVSRCHGWSGGPAALFPEYILGVRPMEPGFKRVRIAPDLGGLPWAEGSVPTPMGDIHVRLQDTERTKGEIILPEGMEGFLVRPGRKCLAIQGKHIID
ncbi:MAG: alpha-L-rhamnosidase C-terminal domain-containing protein [Clostridia bacterium]